MKKYNRFNFFKHTYCEWKVVPFTIIENRKPDYKSEKGSCYYFEEKGLYRYSNHWGRVANCRWKLLTEDKVSQGYYVGYSEWKDFYSNDEKDPNYVIKVDFVDKKIDFEHFMNAGNKSVVRRTAIDTAKRISDVKKVLLSDEWAKYLDCPDVEVAREFLVAELINTTKSLPEIKRKFINSLKND